MGGLNKFATDSVKGLWEIGIVMGHILLKKEVAMNLLQVTSAAKVLKISMEEGKIIAKEQKKREPWYLTIFFFCVMKPGCIPSAWAPFTKTLEKIFFFISPAIHSWSWPSFRQLYSTSEFHLHQEEAYVYLCD